MLAQRAVADSPRWTRAVEDQSASIPERERASLEGVGEGRLDDLLCSRNARPKKALVGHAQWEINLARPQGRRWKSGGRSMRAMETTPAASLDTD